jgi:hypothetical protein
MEKKHKFVICSAIWETASIGILLAFFEISNFSTPEEMLR